MKQSTELDLCGVPIDAASLVLERFGDNEHGFELVVAKLPGSEGAYAIKDKDFPILQAAFIAVGGAFASSLSNWAPGVIASLMYLLVEFRRKRVPLSAVQAAILIQFSLPDTFVKSLPP